MQYHIYAVSPKFYGAIWQERFAPKCGANLYAEQGGRSSLKCRDDLIRGSFPNRLFRILNGAKTESANCHSIADESEHPGRYEFGICKVADRDVLCPEVEVFGAAQESVPGLRAVPRLKADEFDLVPLDERSDLCPQSLIGCQQIDRRHQREVLLIELANRPVEHKAVFFISEVHRSFLTFCDE